MSEPVWMLYATVNRPKAGRGSHLGCGVLVDIVEETGESTADPLLLHHAPMLLRGILQRLLDEDHYLRIDFPRDSQEGSGGAMLCNTTAELDDFLDRVGSRLVGRNARALYPTSVWRIPRVSGSEADLAVCNFRDAPGDQRAFQSVLELNVWRVALFPSSMTLTVPCDGLPDAVELTRTVLASSPLKVDWV
jgi:hypothetical protein